MSSIRIITTRFGLTNRLLPYNKIIEREIKKQSGMISHETFLINRFSGNFNMQNFGINNTTFYTKVNIVDWNSISEWNNWEMEKQKIQLGFKDEIFKEKNQILVREKNFNDIFLL